VACVTVWVVLAMLQLYCRDCNCTVYSLAWPPPCVRAALLWTFCVLTGVVLEEQEEALQHSMRNWSVQHEPHGTTTGRMLTFFSWEKPLPGSVYVWTVIHSCYDPLSPYPLVLQPQLAAVL
jgi:hypothetical protein